MRLSLTALLTFALVGSLAGNFGVLAPAMSYAQGESADDKPAKTGVIKGSVTKNDVALRNSRITVSVVGTQLKKAVEADGTFEFLEVPTGKYTLKAEGTFKGLKHSGELAGVETAARDKAEAVMISVK